VATKIVFSSRLPAAIVDTARAMVPPGFEMTAVDHGTPAFYEALHDAEFYLGFPRPGMGNEFFRAAPRLRLVQLVTAGYDTLDLEAARKAGVPVANCGGSNAVSVAEHTITLMLAVLKRLVWQHTRRGIST
jgi:lactate dehydrogenase-like 2-hydroxyacid dehydrogenase